MHWFGIVLYAYKIKGFTSVPYYYEPMWICFFCHWNAFKNISKVLWQKEASVHKVVTMQQKINFHFA